MITPEEWKEFDENGIPEDRFLTDDIDLVKLWEQYEKENDRAICGDGTIDPPLINYNNLKLAKQAGIQSCLPAWGTIIDLGAGYNCLQSLMTDNIIYRPCDLIKRTPITTLVNGSLPFEDNSADCVVSCNMFQHITPTQRLKYVQESYRVIRPNGTLFIACNMSIGMFSPQTIKFDNKAYCFTGDYLIPVPDFDEIAIWAKVGFGMLNLCNRNDGFTGLWFKTKKEIPNVNE